MKRMGWGRRLVTLWIAALLLVWPCWALADDAESAYFENEWNFVDGSLDVSGGIPEDAEGVLWEIRDAGVLRVATEPYFPPQEFIDPELEGQERFVGSDMELARRLAERMGVELEIVPMDFSEVLEAVSEGKCDLAISALSFTPSRAAQVTMSKGYYFAPSGAGSALIIREADAGDIRSVEDLKGRNVAAQSGSLQETLVAQNVQRYHEFRRLSSMADVYGALLSGAADAAIVDAETGRAYIENNPDCGLTLVEGVRFTMVEQYAGDRIAARKGELMLMYFVNGVIDEVVESGEYQAWYAAAKEYAAKLGM